MFAEDFKFIKPGEVRVRFSPSPTGSLHIGSARTALFNYLFAKKNEGSFVLRIEDTDLERSEKRFEEDIIDNLKWLGIEWSEGPDIGGKYEPYRQTERTASYAKYLEKLLSEDKAYHCFCSEEELEAERQYRMSIGEPPIYSGKCAQLSEAIVKKNLSEGKKSVIRFKVPSKKIIFDDLIREKVEFDTGLMGDIVIAKDLKTPLYNFAVTADDFEMKISHVIRGEDHISNTPKQILIQEALGFNQLIYAHLPLILGTDRSKLSKRHGSVTVSEYRKEGYLPETLINFMAFLGWNPGDEREIYSLPSLVKEFSLEKVQKGGAIFNNRKLDFLNGFYLRKKSTEKLTEFCLPYLIEEGLITPIFKSEQYPPAYGGIQITQEYIISQTKEKIEFEGLERIISIYKERLKKLSEISDLVDFFFEDKLKYGKDLLRWKEMPDGEIKDSLDILEKTLSAIELANWTKAGLEAVLLPETSKRGQPMAERGDKGKLLWPLRVALTGKEASATPFAIAEILGKEKTLKRIKEAKTLLEKTI